MRAGLLRQHSLTPSLPSAGCRRYYLLCDIDYSLACTSGPVDQAKEGIQHELNVLFY